jgi:hypothetical protein
MQEPQSDCGWFPSWPGNRDEAAQSSQCRMSHEITWAATRSSSAIAVQRNALARTLTASILPQKRAYTDVNELRVHINQFRVDYTSCEVDEDDVSGIASVPPPMHSPEHWISIHAKPLMQIE